MGELSMSCLLKSIKPDEKAADLHQSNEGMKHLLKIILLGEMTCFPIKLKKA